MLSVPEIDRGDSFESFLQRDLDKELLRFTTAGSVDDGKSTLIGRLLHDSKGVYEDQLASVRKSRVNRSGRAIDFSLLTDGLRAEREQGITIDVAYRYFSTPRRKFIIADTPGHEQYTRNMATGASTADLAVILVDATKGLLPQTRRHAYISSLLGIPHVLAAINKMDLVGYREGVFLRLERDFTELAGSLGIQYLQCIPISALEGDNVVTRSGNMPWYAGLALMEHLETVKIGVPRNAGPLRFPIQYVIRPDANFRGYAGRVASGVIRPGDSVVALPSGQRTNVQRIVGYEQDLDAAISGQSVVLQLSDEIDLSRGDILASPDAPPLVSSRFAAMVVWLHRQRLQLNRVYLLKHAGRLIKAKAAAIRFQVNVNDLTNHPASQVSDLTNHPASQLEMNGIASVEFEASGPLIFDRYQDNRTTGSFILIDPASNATVGAGMIREALNQGVHTHALGISRLTGAVVPQERSKRHGHQPAILSIEGSLQTAELVERSLFEAGFEALLIRKDEIPRSALSTVLSTLKAAGVLVVYWSDLMSAEERDTLARAGRDFFFEFSESKPSGNSRELLDSALRFAETLCVITDTDKSALVD